MTKKYKYEFEEYSQDVRKFIVESDIKLNKEEITECVSNASYNVHSKVGSEINGHKVYVQYKGTDYGDDCQTNILEIK